MGFDRGRAARNVLLTATPVGNHSRVLINDGGGWADISKMVFGATVRTDAKSLTTVDLQLVAAAADVAGALTDDTMAMLTRIAHDVQWKFPRAPRFSALDLRVAA